jgi:hypothetical protein
MTDLLPCRWRGGRTPLGLYPCRSPKLVTRPEGVPPEVCAGCYCRDHEPPAPEAAPAAPARALPCVHLGRVIDRKDCNCPLRHVYACARHGTCTLAGCRACGDYEPDE